MNCEIDMDALDRYRNTMKPVTGLEPNLVLYESNGNVWFFIERDGRPKFCGVMAPVAK